MTDFRAAFDSVDINCIWNLRSNLGFKKDIIALLKGMYTETLSKVKAYNYHLATVPNPQRSTSRFNTFTFLFNLTIDWSMSSALDGANLGVGLDDMHVADLYFADDICLLDDNKNDAQAFLDKVTSKAAKTGL